MANKRFTAGFESLHTDQGVRSHGRRHSKSRVNNPTKVSKALGRGNMLTASQMNDLKTILAQNNGKNGEK